MDIIHGMRKQHQLQLPQHAAAVNAEQARQARLLEEDGFGTLAPSTANIAEQLAESEALQAMWRWVRVRVRLLSLYCLPSLPHTMLALAMSKRCRRNDCSFDALSARQ